jgi:cysteine-S-conjugate beta-lyase
MTRYDFDEEIDRRVVPALKTHRIVLGEDGGDLFPAGVADMDYRAPPEVLGAIKARLEHGVFGYETVSDSLMSSLIRWLEERHGWTVDKSDILRAPNILNALAIAASLFTREDDGIIVQPPVFFDFFDILRENHRNIVTNPLVLDDGRYVMDFEDLETKAADPLTKMIFLCNPHNPVGRVWTATELRQLGDICARHSVLVVSDEMHGDLVFPGHEYTPFASLGPAFATNSITCLSPAKTFNIAACCSAFTVVPDEDKRRQFQAENNRLTVNKNNAFANAAMEAAYAEGGTWLDAAIEYLEGNVDLVKTRLASIPGVKLVEPEGTFLVWLDFRDLNLDTELLTQFLRRQAKWAVTRGHAFGDSGAGFARLNIGCTRARLATAMDQLAVAVAENQ